MFDIVVCLVLRNIIVALMTFSIWVWVMLKTMTHK